MMNRLHEDVRGVYEIQKMVMEIAIIFTIGLLFIVASKMCKI